MNLKRSICVIAVMMCILCPSMGTADWGHSPKLKIAVMDLLSRVDREKVDVITLTEMLQAALADTKAFQVVERGMLSKILEEQKLSMSGLTEGDASRVGALAGAQKIITGSISQMGKRYILILKGIDTRTGIVELTDQAIVRDIDGLISVIPRIAERIVRKARGETVGVPPSLQEEARPAESIILEDHFTDNRNGWPTGDWDAASAALRDGQYVITMKKQIPIFYSKIDLAMDPAKNFSVEATIAKLGGEHGDTSSGYYGVIFGRDFENMYEFCVHPSGRHMIRRRINGKTSFIQSSIPSSRVNRANGSNTFGIVKKGNILTFFMNGHEINKEQGNLLLSNVNLIGYTTWRTPAKDLRIAGTHVLVRQDD